MKKSRNGAYTRPHVRVITLRELDVSLRGAGGGGVVRVTIKMLWGEVLPHLYVQSNLELEIVLN